jgi:hypothetical protein
MIEIGTAEAKRPSAPHEEETALPDFLATLAALGVANDREDHEALGYRGGPCVPLLCTHAFETCHWRERRPGQYADFLSAPRLNLVAVRRTPVFLFFRAGWIKTSAGMSNLSCRFRIMFKERALLPRITS